MPLFYPLTSFLENAMLAFFMGIIVLKKYISNDTRQWDYELHKDCHKGVNFDISQKRNYLHTRIIRDGTDISICCPYC